MSGEPLTLGGRQRELRGKEAQMLNDQEFLVWCCRLNLGEPAQAAIRNVRSSPPARRVAGGRGNVSGRYPSRKMGVTIQFESHRVELAFVHAMEHDPDVLEYYDQPPSITLQYSAASGRHVRVQHTPDYFVMRQASAGWEECKSEAELPELAKNSPNRYRQKVGGLWHCPPGEAFGESLGLYYRVRSSEEIDRVFLRNIEFLDDYLRYTGPAVAPTIRATVCDYVAANPGTSLSELFSKTEGIASRDHIYSMIVDGEVYVDLRGALMVEPNRVRVFADGDTAVEQGPTLPPDPDSGLMIFPGKTFSWDGKSWAVANVGQSMVGLLGEDEAFIEIPLLAFEKLLKEGRIVNTGGPATLGTHSAVAKRFLAASKQDLETANKRASVVREYLQSRHTLADLPARTLFRWVSRFRDAQDAYGNGYVGLLPDSRNRGNRSKRLPAETRRLMRAAIEEDFETLKQKRMLQCWAALKNRCDEHGVPSPSYVTFCSEARKQPVSEQISKRQGHRSAYAYKPFYWSLDLATPCHGERPFEIAHIDHTEADIELVSSQTGRPLGRPWWTLMIDAFSRRILAIDLVFDPPSYRSCMMVLRECVRRHMRLPQTIVVDNGAEFRGTYFESLLARYECTKKQRPPAQSRFGSICERLFGTANTQFFHNLRGNTQIVRHCL